MWYSVEENSLAFKKGKDETEWKLISFIRLYDKVMDIIVHEYLPYHKVECVFNFELLINS